MVIGTDWIGNGISNYPKIHFFHRGPCINDKLKINITKFENEIGVVLTSLTLPHFSACPNPEPKLPSDPLHFGVRQCYTSCCYDL